MRAAHAGAAHQRGEIQLGLRASRLRARAPRMQAGRTRVETSRAGCDFARLVALARSRVGQHLSSTGAGRDQPEGFMMLSGFEPGFEPATCGYNIHTLTSSLTAKLVSGNIEKSRPVYNQK